MFHGPSQGGGPRRSQMFLGSHMFYSPRPYSCVVSIWLQYLLGPFDRPVFKLDVLIVRSQYVV